MIGRLEPTIISALQPTHEITLKCSEDGTKVLALASKIKPPGLRRYVWVYPYGLPTCPQCGGTLAESK